MEVAGFGESAKSNEFADGECVCLETVGDEEGVGWLDLMHSGATLREIDASGPCSAAEIGRAHV